MKKIIEDINYILAEWNPVGVPSDIATEEYKAYIPLILRSIQNHQQLKKCLEYILVSRIGVDYDPMNNEHLTDLQRVCEKIIQVYKNEN